MMKGHNINKENTVLLSMITVVVMVGIGLASSVAKADDVVDEINITVPVSCTISGTGMTSHNASINNGLYEDDIGSTTLHAFCNDTDGFTIYAAGYTGDEVGGTNSNKLVGTTASGNAVIETGLATTAGNPDVSNWAMKLTATQDSGDTTGTNAFAIDSAPNTSGGADASFTQYHVVPNEYTKVAHKNSGTDMTASTGGVKLTTTYAAYISKTQPADTYSGQVIYTLVHPSSAAAPVGAGKVGVTYHANGSTFTGGATTNRVVYASSPMYIATTPLIAKSANVGDDGTQNGSYATGNTLTPVTAAGASKMKVVIHYGLSSGTMLPVVKGDYDGQSAPGDYEMIEGPAAGTTTYTFDSDTVTFYMIANNTPTSADGQDYGYYAEVYPIYMTEQTDTEPSVEFETMSGDVGIYAQTTDWYGSWYANINNEHYDFVGEPEIADFLMNNIASLDGMNIDLYRGLSFDEAYARANKTYTSGGYHVMQDLDSSISCPTIALSTTRVIDIRDNTVYMIGRLRDGNCWMLDNLALDPTDSTTATNMNSNNTNATTEAIANYLYGGSSNTGWSNIAVRNVISGFANSAEPMINNVSKNTLVTSYGPASTSGQAKVGIYYNYCAATVGTYCYAGNNGVDVPDTIIDAPQDVCPANWRMPTGGDTGEYFALMQEYGSVIATSNNSLQYNLSTPLSGTYYYIHEGNQGSNGYWWSSTYNDGNNMYALGGSASTITNFGYCRDCGSTMRCLVGE